MLDKEICVLKPPTACLTIFRLLSTVLTLLKLSNSWTTFMSLSNANTTHSVIYLIFLLRLTQFFMYKYICECVYFIVIMQPVSFASVEGDLKYN